MKTKGNMISITVTGIIELKAQFTNLQTRKTRDTLQLESNAQKDRK